MICNDKNKKLTVISPGKFMNFYPIKSFFKFSLRNLFYRFQMNTTISKLNPFLKPDTANYSFETEALKYLLNLVDTSTFNN